jgi:hypothetical protein
MGRRRPPLSIEQVLAWADAHYARTGRWPTAASGPVEGAPGEAWGNINAALSDGYRGHPGGNSLARLLDRRRGRGHGRVPWTPAEDELARALPPAEAAARTGRTLPAVYQRRYQLGVGLPPRPAPAPRPGGPPP